MTSMGHHDDEARELRLFLDNDRALYKRSEAIQVNLAKHWCRGGFQPKKAAKAFQYVADEAGKKYAKEFGTEDWKFPKAARTRVARDLAADFIRDVRRCQRRGVCDLPGAAAQVLKSTKCKVRR